MVLLNFPALRKPRLFRYLLVALILVLTLVGLPRSLPKVSAADTGNSPQIGGPLVPTFPFSIDSGDVYTADGNYARLVIYTWGLDPAVEQDSQNDYFIVLITATTQAKFLSNWCASHTDPDIFPTQEVGLAVSNESPQGTSILPEISPRSGETGGQTGEVSAGISVTIGGDS